ncbi:MAG: type II toxin-antitoxin system HipA family toxin [Pseudomonadota bacterium]
MVRKIGPMPEGIRENRLDVVFRDRLIGRLWLDERRRFSFQYDGAWLRDKSAIPLSLSLPLTSKPYIDDTARPFFSNLLPEAGIRKIIARRLGISEKNDFSLLREIGGECAGAVSLVPEGTYESMKPGYREINEEELNNIVAELPNRPFLLGEEGTRLSLAGAQNKLPVYMEGERIFIAAGNAPSSHILKPPMPNFEETVENEAFCMMLASRMGLSVPEASIRVGRPRLFIVERYDRARDDEGRLMRLHQEDFCQALGILPEHKYESEGGPSLAACFSLLKKNSPSPAADQKALVMWVVFNVLIGNADAHGKNLAILYAGRGPRLAPFYDLLCTGVYPDLSDRFAMRIGRENRPGWIQPRHWERFSADVGIKPRLIHRIAGDMAQSIVPLSSSFAGEFMDRYGHSPLVERIVQNIGQAAASLKTLNGE